MSRKKGGSLVILRSWVDGPPKIKGIAPPDDERSVKLEPDLQGHFLAEEVTDPERDPKFAPRGRVFGASRDGNGIEPYSHQNGRDLSPEPPFMRQKRRNEDFNRNREINRHSYSAYGESNIGQNGNTHLPTSRTRHLSPSKGNERPESLHYMRPNSAGTSSPDQQDGSSMEYTPPSSPVNGRYRNLGPELAATIPKRTIKSNWITDIKARWIKSTTHPDSGRNVLKSYSSSPSLVDSSYSEGSPVYNPLYKLSHKHQLEDPQTGAGSSASSSGIVVSTDEEDRRSRSSLSNQTSTYSPSPSPNNQSPVAVLRQQILAHSSRPNGIQKHGSLTDFSEEEIFSGTSTTGSSSPTGSPLLGLGEGEACQDLQVEETVVEDECVLVEVIRKPESPAPSNNNHNNPLLAGNHKGTKNEKRHSIGELEYVLDNRFAGVKVEGSPGKVARLKENIKRFGRFGRNHSEKILRFRTGEEIQENNNTTKKQTGKNKKAKSSSEEILPFNNTERRGSKDGAETISNDDQVDVKVNNFNKPNPLPFPIKVETEQEEIQSEETRNPPPDTVTEVSNYIGENEVGVDHMGEDEEESIISDQDRSMSSHSQLAVTFDDETFIVHSGCSAIETESAQKRNNCSSDGSNGDNNEKFHVDVTLDDFKTKQQELHVIPDQPDEMFQIHYTKNDQTTIIPEMREGSVQAVINKLSQSNGRIGKQIMTNGKQHQHPNGTASVQVPVQAINRHVMMGRETGPCDNNAYPAPDHTTVDDRGPMSPESRSVDFEWHRSSSTRDSFRGFCEGILQQDDKITIHVPEIVEASINFDNEDNSSLDPDEERENSVEYISIADVKVRHHGRKLEKGRNGNKEHLPSCVISLDIGSRGSGFSYWVRDQADCVRIGNVDAGSQCPSSHKIPSWVSFDELSRDGEDEEDNATSVSSPSFGHHALNRFLSQETQTHLFYKWRETFNECSTFPYTLDSKPNEDELQMTFKSTIKHYAKLALDQIASRRIGNALGHTIIAIAIPSTYDRNARRVVRDSAFASGLIAKKDCLVLIEDPCAAGIYAYHAIKSKISKILALGTSFLSVDIGAVYLHSCGYEFQYGKLRQILTPKSQPISESPESLFEAELSGVFTPSFLLNYQTKFKAGWIKLMMEFDRCQSLYDPNQRGTYFVFLPSSFVDHFRRFTSMEVEDALESTDLSWSRVGALGIPYWKMQRLLQPLMDFAKNHVTNLIRSRNFEFLILTGGRSGSKQLSEYLKNAVRDLSVDVIVPKEHNAAVLQGCTISLTNLAPRLVIPSPFSIGVGVMTPFLEGQHPEEKKVLRDGKAWCADVWDSLITVGQELEINTISLKRAYVGAQPGQSVLILPIFQSPQEPKFVTEPSVKKCCEFKFNSGQRAWQEVEIVIKCRPSELLIMALDDGITKSVVVLDLVV